MKKLIYRRKPMKNRIFAATAALMAIAFSTASYAEETKVALCKYCNSSAFQNAAEVAALSETPRLQEGTQYVFVVDSGTDEIRYYEVVRENVEICQSSADAGVGTLSTLDPDDPGPVIPECFENWVTSSTQLAPPAATVAELREMQEEFDKFRQEIQDFNLDELDLGAVPLDSAADLLGPNSGAFRNALQNAISDRMTDAWWKRLLTDASDLGRQFWERIIGDPGGLGRPIVHFPDGTEVKLEVEDLERDEFGFVHGFKIKIDVTSARGEQLSSLPTTPGEFVRFFGSGFTGNVAFVENLSDLFVRGGGRVRRGPSTGGCFATIMCWIEDGEEVCQGSRPDPELSDC